MKIPDNQKPERLRKSGFMNTRIASHLTCSQVTILLFARF